MAASTGDKITDVRNAARPNSARATGTRSAGGTSLACENLIGWPTASKVHFVTYQIDSSSNPIAGTQLDCSGIVSGNTIGSFTVIDGSDVGNSVNDVVEMLPTAAWAQDLATALTAQHTRTGTHTAITTDTIVVTNGTTLPAGDIATADLADSSVTTAKIADDNVTASKMVNGQIYRRQGGNASNWNTVGTSTFDVSASDVKIQTGSVLGTGDATSCVVTFPTAFTNTPIIVGSPYGSGGNMPTWYLVSESNTGFTLQIGVNVGSFKWIAIGI